MKPSIIIDRHGRRHTGGEDRKGTPICTVARKHGYCAYCSRLRSRMPEPSGVGQRQRCDVPMSLKGKGLDAFLSSRTDLIRLYWDLERVTTPQNALVSFRHILDDPDVQRISQMTVNSLPSPDLVRKRAIGLRLKVRARLFSCYQEVRGPQREQSRFFAAQFRGTGVEAVEAAA